MPPGPWSQICTKDWRLCKLHVNFLFCKNKLRGYLHCAYERFELLASMMHDTLDATWRHACCRTAKVLRNHSSVCHCKQLIDMFIQGMLFSIPTQSLSLPRKRQDIVSNVLLRARVMIICVRTDKLCMCTRLSFYWQIEHPDPRVQPSQCCVRPQHMRLMLAPTALTSFRP